MSPVTNEPGNVTKVLIPVSALKATNPDNSEFILTAIIASNPFHFVSTKGTIEMAIKAVNTNTTASIII
jgi:hypothetical protein